MMKSIKFILIVLISSIFLSCNCPQKNNKQSEIIEFISVSDVQKLDSNVQLIDVRTPEEYAEGFITNAQNINLYDDDFLSQISILDKNKPVYVYCKSGGRSEKVATQLKEAGFTKIYDLKGGIAKWISEGKAISKK